MKKIIFTDLDGTLINYDGSFKEAIDAIELIKEQNIPLVINTSKPFKEVVQLQTKLGISEPFIVENGGAIFFPKNYRGFDLEFLDDYDKNYKFFKISDLQDLEYFYHNIKEQFNIISTNDMSIKEFCQYANVDEQKAKSSKNREFSIPFIFKDKKDLQELNFLANEQGLKVLEGRKYSHLINYHQDKGLGVRKTINIFQKLYKEYFYAIALGDNYNDIEMLKSVDLPILIKRKDETFIDFEWSGLQKSTKIASNGFKEMIYKILL